MTALGKRKVRSSEDDEDVDAQEALRRHFEARFKPLAVAPVAASRAAKQKRAKDSNSDSDSDSDSGKDEDEDDYSGSESDDGWGGVSDNEHDDSDEEDEQDTETRPTVEIVDHSSSGPKVEKMSKRELKAYLSSRPPSHSNSEAQSTSSKKSKKSENGEDGDQPEDSAAFLANDLALQRLIAESHILSAAGGNASHWQSSAAASTAANTRTFAAGRTAKKTTDLRFQALGAKDSILTQAKMPMAMRKGIQSTAAAREGKRRREAKENGIILEREVRKQQPARKKGHRERPVDAPGVGRMRGSELRISAREARAISSDGVRRGGGGGGGGGRGKKRR
ncbi:hypothetical protein QBC42DRAFT_279670 [Cladorrhinum samala]|uniref:Protein FAF1 n=1 Tax=Cladorrhinum samala TaxID=585594 RepID=A0AAV9HCA3_9PEZI|nr:hypothetical protein QBC42DRAFT_279670 [Cladorrhinum samala]